MAIIFLFRQGHGDREVFSGHTCPLRNTHFVVVVRCGVGGQTLTRLRWDSLSGELVMVDRIKDDMGDR